MVSIQSYKKNMMQRIMFFLSLVWFPCIYLVSEKFSTSTRLLSASLTLNAPSRDNRRLSASISMAASHSTSALCYKHLIDRNALAEWIIKLYVNNQRTFMLTNIIFI